VVDGPRILFHTAGDHAIGLGHVVRCLALAAAMKERAPACRVSFRVQGPPEVVSRVEAAGFATTADPGAQAVVIDVPDHLPGAIQGTGALTVSIDNPGASRYEADLAIAMLYEPRAGRPAGSRTQDLRGLPYVILNPAFRDLPSKAVPARAERILICQGGSDTYGMTSRICSALKPLDGKTRFDVVLGPAYRHDAELQAAAGGDDRFRLHRAVPSLKALMETADLCVSAAGMTSLELAAVGVPMILVVTESKEAETARLLANAGAARFPGGPECVDDGRLLAEVRALQGAEPERRALSLRARECVDGRGAFRVADAILKALRERNG
jgi:spore coat polysaccharide biosynthesis predicted glycosyltransferase SpsG